jgi:hypothetical protein
MQPIPLSSICPPTSGPPRIGPSSDPYRTHPEIHPHHGRRQRVARLTSASNRSVLCNQHRAEPRVALHHPPPRRSSLAGSPPHRNADTSTADQNALRPCEHLPQVSAAKGEVRIRRWTAHVASRRSTEPRGI